MSQLLAHLLARKPFYMPQDLFNYLVFVIAWGKVLYVGEDESAKNAVLEKLLENYRGSYPSDELFESELLECVDGLLSWIDDTYIRASRVGWLGVMQEVTTKYLPDGARKKWRLFNGVWFTSDRIKPENRKGKFFRDLMLYYANVETGKIPVENLVHSWQKKTQ